MSPGETQLAYGILRLRTAGSVPAQFPVHPRRIIVEMVHLHNAKGMAQEQYTQDAGHNHTERIVEELHKARTER